MLPVTSELSCVSDCCFWQVSYITKCIVDLKTLLYPDNTISQQTNKIKEESNCWTSKSKECEVKRRLKNSMAMNISQDTFSAISSVRAGNHSL